MKITLLTLAVLQALHVQALVIATPKDHARHHHWTGDPIEKLMLKVNHVSDVKPPSGIETVNHDKDKNGGYKEGSPLYKKQENIAQQSDDEEPKKEASALRAVEGFSVQVPPSVRQMMPSFHEILTYVSVYVIFVIAFAYAYWKRQPSLTGKRELSFESLPRCGFAYSFLDCSNLSNDWPICLWAWCCPIVQWAGTASKSSTQFMGYWKAVALMLVLAVLTPFTYGLTGLLMLIILFIRRRKLRKAYNHKSSESLSCLWDMGLVFCCNSFVCCQLVQEAREVEYTVPQQPPAPTPSSASLQHSMVVQTSQLLEPQKLASSGGSMPMLTPRWEQATQPGNMRQGGMDQRWVQPGNMRG